MEASWPSTLRTGVAAGPGEARVCQRRHGGERLRRSCNCLPALAAVAVGACHGLPRSRVARLPSAVFAVLYSGFYALPGLPGVRTFNWYLLPIEPLYLLVAAAGLARFDGLRKPWLAAVLLVWQ